MTATGRQSRTFHKPVPGGRVPLIIFSPTISCSVLEFDVSQVSYPTRAADCALVTKPRAVVVALIRVRILRFGQLFAIGARECAEIVVEGVVLF